MGNYVSEQNINEILEGVSKKIPQGIMIGDTYIGHITWQMYLLKDYLKLDGTPLANASVNYKELLKFAQDNELITADTTDNSLFKYNSTTDVLTLPDYIDLVLQGGDTPEVMSAGLPNIKGRLQLGNTNNSALRGNNLTGPWEGLESSAKNNAEGAIVSDGYAYAMFDASKSNSIYSDSVNTVQPPAITLIPQIKYRTTTSIWDTVQIGKFVATAPAHYEREQLYTTNKTTITIYPTWININGMGYVLEGTKIIDIENADTWDDSTYTSAAQRAGKDFYIYATQPVSNDAPNFILSANSTVPTGYTADNSRKIGGFHCLCLSVGTISGHTLSGYLTGDILPQSPWDLKHRAVSENEGMVYIPEVNKWVDIYLASYDGAKLVSEYNAIIADGASNPIFHGEKFVEYFGLVKKQLPSRDDFMVFAKGSNEGTNISGSADPNTTGGHIDTNSRRMISNYGIEDCCGALWQWSQDCPEAQSVSYSAGNYWMNSYSWVANPVYNPNCDTQSYGSCYGLLRRLVVGGSWSASSYCGSRCVFANHFGAVVAAAVSSRGCSKSRI